LAHEFRTVSYRPGNIAAPIPSDCNSSGSEIIYVSDPVGAQRNAGTSVLVDIDGHCSLISAFESVLAAASLMNASKVASHAHGAHVLVVTMLAVALLLSFSAMAFVIGQHRHDQNVAEAAAMAGAQELPLNPAGAISKATQWAMSRGIQPSQIKSVQVRTTSYTNDTLYIEIHEERQWTIGRLLSKVTHLDGVNAAARVASLSTGHTMPWGLLAGDPTCLDGSAKAILSAICTVKVGAHGIVNGWYGALDYDGKGGGAAEYKANIIDGTTDRKYCIANDPALDCASAFSVIDTLDGNQVGQTDQGIDERTAVAPCDANKNGRDDFNEVFSTYPSSTPSYSVLCPNSPRLIILPIVSDEATPVKTVTIRGWVLAYLNNYGCEAIPIGSQAPDAAVATASKKFNPPGAATPTPGAETNASNAHAYVSVLASPTPGPPEPCHRGKGHWQVIINIVDAAYSQTTGFLSVNNPASGTKIRGLGK